MTPNKAVKQLLSAMAHPDAHKRLSPGLTLGNDAEPVAAPLLDGSVVQRTAKLEVWGEVDLMDAQRFTRIYTFGGEGDLIGVSATQYFDPLTRLSFDAPSFSAATDLLLMMVSAEDGAQMARRLFALEEPEPIEKIGVRKSVLTLVSAINEHGYIDALDALAKQRGRRRIVIHTPGDNARYKQLLGGFGFTREKTSDGFLSIREVK